MLTKLSLKLPTILALLGVVLILGGSYYVFFRQNTSPPDTVTTDENTTETKVDPCVVGALEADITPCQVLVHLNPYEFADLDETQKLELIDNIMSSSNVPFTSFSLLPSKTEVILLVNTPFGQEEAVGQQLLTALPKYVVKFNVIDKLEIQYN